MQGKTLYNLLRLSLLEDPAQTLEPWQIEDYRQLKTPELFSRLKQLGINLTEKVFLQYAEKSASPEDLAETLWTEEEYSESFDKMYLLLFELWRRLLPHNQTLSLFCDELDHLIFLYDLDKLEDEQPLQKALQELEKILDEHVDQGGKSSEVFAAVTEFCAHDLESFLYNYISSQIDQGNGLYASELIDGFYEYIPDKKWLDFLRMRLLIQTDADEGNLMLRRILEEQTQEPNLELLFGIAHFLTHQGDQELFIRTMKLVRPLIKTEAEFQEMLTIATEFYCLGDQTDQEKEIRSLLAERSSHVLNAPISASDVDFSRFFNVLE